jgi:hypothetical protein
MSAGFAVGLMMLAGLGAIGFTLDVRLGQIADELKRLADQFEAPKMFGEKK